MELNKRRLQHDDYDTIVEWWKSWPDWVPLARNLLPENGTGGIMIERDGIPIVAGFLYSTNSKLPNRFINPAPFSKFYLEGIDGESPGKIGQYIGWQIVKAYMDNNDTSFKDMLIMNAQELFNKSKFKPKKSNG